MAVIGILGMGTMGAAVGAALKSFGHRVLTDLRGRSDMSVRRAMERGIMVTDDLNHLMTDVDILLSIVPPDDDHRDPTERQFRFHPFDRTHECRGNRGTPWWKPSCSGIPCKTG